MLALHLIGLEDGLTLEGRSKRAMNKNSLQTKKEAFFSANPLHLSLIQYISSRLCQNVQVVTFKDFNVSVSSLIIGSLSVATNTLVALAFFTTFLVFLRISLFSGRHI